MKRITVILTCDEQEHDNDSLIKDDIERELGCCWHLFDIESVEIEMIKTDNSDESVCDECKGCVLYHSKVGCCEGDEEPCDTDWETKMTILCGR